MNYNAALRATARTVALREAQQILANAGIKADIIVKAPQWKPGDVVVVRFYGNSTPYTYVRGALRWPGEHVHKTDDEITSLYNSGNATPVLQSGGQPFASSRLP